MMLTAIGIAACSSADEPEGDDSGTGGSSGSGGTATGGSSTGGTATGGSSTGGTATGGSSTGGTATGGSSTGGTTGTNTDPECKSIKSNMSCPIEGKACPNLVCGIADSGTRECNCATNWTCSACNYDNSPFKDRPADIVACGSDAADEVPCTTPNQVCGPIGEEYCACYQNEMDGLIWDCDKPPTTWM